MADLFYLGADYKDLINAIDKVDAALLKAGSSVSKFGNVFLQLDENGDIASATIKTVAKDLGELTQYFTKTNGVLEATGSSFKSLKSNVGSVSATIKELSANLASIAGISLQKTTSNDLIQQLVPQRLIKNSTIEEYNKASAAANNYQEVLSGLVNSEKITELQAKQTFAALRSGNFKNIVSEAQPAVAAYLKMTAALDKLGEAAGRAKVSQERLSLARTARTTLLQQFNPRQIPEASQKEAQAVTKNILDVARYVKNSEIELQDFQNISNLVFKSSGKAVNNFTGELGVLFDKIIKVNAAFQQLGTKKAKIDFDESAFTKKLDIAKSKISDISKGFGQLTFSPNLNQTQIDRFNRQLQNIYSKSAKVLASAEKNTTPIDVDKVISATKSGQIAVDQLSNSEYKLAKLLQDRIDLHNRVGEASQRADEKASKATNAAIAAQQATNKQAQALANTPGLFDQVSKESIAKFNIPVKALNFTDKARLEANFADIATAIAKGSIQLQDFSNHLDSIKNKEILAPDANENINKLRSNLTNIASTTDHITNRVNRLKDSIITMTNAMRLLVVSELYVMFSTLRSGIEQAIRDSQKLSIQIGQIQAITQETNTTTQEWAQTLREVSDLSGKSITEVSIAAYDSLSNQITKTKDDTKDFLNTALEFGRTVGATPTESVNLLSSAINAFGKSSKDARDLSAQFFAVIDIGRIKAADLQNIYGRAAIAGAKLGVTTQEMGAALAVLTQNGLTTEDAVTRLNNLFIKLINPTKEMEKLFTSLGITSGEQLIKMNGFAGAIQRIEASINNGNVALSELFPEIRTLVGFLGLSGQNAVKFSDALEQVKDSMGRFNQASKLTKVPFGQTFAEEFEKIKNIFAVDYFGQLQEGIAKISVAFGGIADKIKFIIDRSLELGKVAGAVASVYLVYKNAIAIMTLLNTITKANTVSMVALTGATKGSLAALLLTPWGQFAAAAAASFAIVSIALDHIEESAKRLNEELRKTGEKRYLSSGLKRDFDEVVKDSNKLYSDLSGTLQKVFGTVAQRISTSYTVIIDNQKKKIKELVDATKSAFDDIQNIIGKTISAIENASKELGSIKRDLIKESIDYVASENRSALEDTLTLQKQIDDARSQAINEAGGVGVKGPTSKQLNIIDQLVQENKKSEGQLKDQIKNVLKNTYNVSEAKSLADDWLKTNKDSIDKYKELIREINSSRINPGQGFVGSQLSVKEINDRILALRQERDAFRSNLFGLLDQTAKNKDSELAPALKLKDELQSLQKQITDIDLDKILSQAHDVRDNTGKIIETRTQQINKALAPYRKAQEDLVAKVNTISPQLKKAGLFSDFQIALQNLQKQINGLNTARLDLIINELNFDTVTKGTKAFEALNREVKELNERLVNTDSILQKLFGEVGQIIPNLKPITSGTYVNPIFNKLNIQTKLLQEALNKPIDSNYSTNVRSAIENVLIELNKLKGQFPNITANLSNTLDQLKNKFEEIDTTVTHQNTLKTQFNKVNQAVLQLSREVSESIPAALLTTEEAWKQMATNIEGFNEKNIISTTRLIEVLSKANALTNQLGIRPENKIQGSPEGAIVPIPQNHATGGKIPGYAHGGRIAAATAMSQFSPGLHKLNRGGVDALSSAHKKTPFHYAAGGPVGTDTVPAWLTPGEFVMPRKETEMFLPILEAMRKKTFVPQVYGMGGRVYNYSSGGKVNNTTHNNQNIHVTIYGQADESLGRKIGREIQREVRRGNVKLS